MKCMWRFRVTKEGKGREARPLWRGQLWSWNDAWKNIVLSLVSTQFVMSLTHSLSRLRREGKCLTSRSRPPCQETNPNKWRNQSTAHNLPNSIEREEKTKNRFVCLFVVSSNNYAFCAKHPPTSLLWEREVFSSHLRGSGWLSLADGGNSLEKLNCSPSRELQSKLRSPGGRIKDFKEQFNFISRNSLRLPNPKTLDHEDETEKVSISFLK